MNQQVKGITHHPVAKWLVLLILAAGVFFFNVFIVPVLAALIIGFATWPFYDKLLRWCRGRSWLSASIAIFVVILLIVIPLTWALLYLLHEIKIGYAWLIELNKWGKPTPLWLQHLPLVGQYIHDYWMENLAHPNGLGEVSQLIGVGYIANISGLLVSGSREFFSKFLSLVLVLITLFFVYKDGRKFARQLDKIGESILPQRWRRISRVVPLMVSSTVTGMVIIAIGEGIVLGIAYYIAGAPSPVTLGIITGFMALVPGGAPLSMSLVSLYLVGSGNSLNGTLLFVWGAIELFIVDKTIRPRLVGGAAKLPFLPTFFGLVGGVKTLGLVGLFIGPVLMALIVAIWREWLWDEENDLYHHFATDQQSRSRHFRRRKKRTLPQKNAEMTSIGDGVS